MGTVVSSVGLGLHVVIIFQNSIFSLQVIIDKLFKCNKQAGNMDK